MLGERYIYYITFNITLKTRIMHKSTNYLQWMPRMQVLAVPKGNHIIYSTLPRGISINIAPKVISPKHTIPKVLQIPE